MTKDGGLPMGVGDDMEASPDFKLLGLVFDEVSRRMVLGHRVTGETQTLEATGWELCEEDGFGFLLRDGEGADDVVVKWASEILAVRLCMKKENDEYVQKVVIGEHSGTPHVVDLVAFLSQMQYFRVSFNIGRMRATLVHSCAHLGAPRNGCVWWWKLADIHANCRLGNVG